jgi:hypothetical protein
MKPFQGFNWGKEAIELEDNGKHLFEGKPTQIHFKENGAIGERPIIAIIIEFAPITPFYAVGQISIDMFNDGAKDFGYKLVKIEEKW